MDLKFKLMSTFGMVEPQTRRLALDDCCFGPARKDVVLSRRGDVFIVSSAPVSPSHWNIRVTRCGKGEGIYNNPEANMDTRNTVPDLCKDIPFGSALDEMTGRESYRVPHAETIDRLMKGYLN